MPEREGKGSGKGRFAGAGGAVEEDDFPGGIGVRMTFYGDIESLSRLPNRDGLARGQSETTESITCPC